MDDLATRVRARPVTSRAEVLERLRTHETDIKALFVTALHLYGSAARDQMSVESDVDIFADYDPHGAFSFVELIRVGKLLEALLGRKVDFATRDGLHPSLRPHIEATSQRIF